MNSDIYAVVIINQATGEPKLLGPYDAEQDVIDAAEALTDAAVMRGVDEYYYPAVVSEVERNG